MRCVNCQLCISRLRRHRLSDQTDEIVERVRRWVNPLDITGNNYLCHSCWELINQNHESAKDQTQQQLGHNKVCIGCGKSILRIRSRLITRPTMSKMESKIANIISQWIQPCQLTPVDEICIPCYLRAKRNVGKSNRSSDIPVPSTSQGISAPSTSQGVNIHSPNQQTEEVVEVQINHSTTVGPLEGIPGQIVMPTLRRAADTSSRCLFLECVEKRRIPESIRKHVIKRYNFYIPRNARICDFHLSSQLYRELYAAENSMMTFSATHIEEIVFLLANDTHLDFQNPENIDGHLFKYWFGQTKEEFNQILIDAPQLQNNKLKSGLAALLCKMRTEDSNERIAELFQIPRRTLEGYVYKACEVLYQNNISIMSQKI